MSHAIEIRHLDVLFGARSKQLKTHALAALDRGEGRDAIRENLGVVAGVVDASLDVPAGEIVVLMGLSGSGKSSLLRAVNGLNPSARGQIRVSTSDGVLDVCKLSGRSLRQLRRRSLAMVFQHFGLLPWASVAENVGFGLSVRGDSRSAQESIIKRQLELVGLDEWADAPISSLSGGMQQRVGLARAFATEADILLMDEPFSALDPLIREHLQTELLDLQATLGRTILFVSHDLDEALRLGSRIAIMDGGRIVQYGTPDDIVFRPANNYVERFVQHVNPLSVLTAATVMCSITDADSTSGQHVPIDSSVRDLLVIAADNADPLIVVRDERAVGIIKRESLLLALAQAQRDRR